MSKDALEKHQLNRPHARHETCTGIRRGCSICSMSIRVHRANPTTSSGRGQHVKHRFPNATPATRSNVQANPETADSPPVPHIRAHVPETSSCVRNMPTAQAAQEIRIGTEPISAALSSERSHGRPALDAPLERLTHCPCTASRAPSSGCAFVRVALQVLPVHRVVLPGTSMHLVPHPTLPTRS